MAAAIPTFRSQGNALFRKDVQDVSYKRGQIVPYEVNGSPTLPPEEPGALIININDMPLATPTEPLFEFEVPAGGMIFSGSDQISAGVAATAPSALRLFKNGSANGTITFTGTSGTASFSDSTYAEGDLFGLYPPTSVDATLDRLRITLGTD
jgi:hypothetical protein